MKKVLLTGLVFIALLILPGAVSAQMSASGPATSRPNMNTNRQQKTPPVTNKLREKAASNSAEKRANRAWIHKATVTAINGTSLTITKDGKTFAITTTTRTKFRRHYGGSATLSQFAVGNSIDVMGQWTDATQTAVTASTIRNRSIMILRGAFIGEVVSKTGNTLVIATKNRGNQTVTVNNTTGYISRQKTPISLTDIIVGHKIRVRGMWDKSNNTITQVTQVKDFSLPAVETTLSPTASASSGAAPTIIASPSAIAQ